MSRLYVNFEDLASYVGEEAALRLCDHLGGSRIWVPVATKVHDGLQLVQAIGVDAARQLALALQAGDSGISIDIPIANAASRGAISAARRRAIVQFLAAENPLPEAAIARQFRVTERHVRHVKMLWQQGSISGAHSSPRQTRQLKLFSH
jgi:hypothetical protein